MILSLKVIVLKMFYLLASGVVGWKLWYLDRTKDTVLIIDAEKKNQKNIDTYSVVENICQMAFLMNNDAVNEVNKMNNRRWSLNANKKLKQKQTTVGVDKLLY